MSRVEKHTKTKEEKEIKMNNKLYFLFMLILAAALVTVIAIQYQDKRTYDLELNSLEVDIINEQERNEELKKQSDNLRSTEYIEKMAREKGYVKSNEIIFYEQ